MFLIEDVDAECLADELRLELIEACESNNCSQSLLDQVAGSVSSAWKKDVRLKLIPYGLDEQEQTAILSALAADVDEGDDVMTDVTHGFRSLPMLAMMAAFYLEAVRGTSIQGIYYGMLELSRETGITPVVQLDGLLKFGRWIGALQQFEKDGDYSVFSPLFKESGVPHSKALADAAFFERITDARHASQKISTVQPAFAKIKELPIATLFSDTLSKRMNWFRKPTFSEKEAELAHAYFKRRDYLRALIFTQEALISREVEREGDGLDNHDRREEAREYLNQEQKFRALGHLRNQMAHGTRGNNTKLKKIMKDEDILKKEISHLMTHLLKSI
ncbi:MAG: TIGR02221 family CRISPR-associated protein [Ghiorsea sp.]|nr:TIGR02221 family CRISPR-associated protein [Ghiorsea sp.]